MLTANKLLQAYLARNNGTSLYLENNLNSFSGMFQYDSDKLPTTFSCYSVGMEEI